jgi:hypothetical protein
MSVKTVKIPPSASYSIQNSQDTVLEDPNFEEAHKINQIFKKNLQDLAKCLNRMDNTLKEILGICGAATEIETIPQAAHVHKNEQLDIQAIKIHGNIKGIDIHLIRAEQFASEMRMKSKDSLSDSETSDDETFVYVSETDISGTIASNSS